jgi:hypothetical protein
VTIDEPLIGAIKSLDRVSELLLSGATISDEQLQALVTSDNTGYLNVLDISKTSITDAGVAGLADKKYLQKLNIQGSQVTEGFTTQLNAARQGNAEIGPGFKSVEVTK